MEEEDFGRCQGSKVEGFLWNLSNMWPLRQKRSEPLAVFTQIAVHQPFIIRSNGLACRSNATS